VVVNMATEIRGGEVVKRGAEQKPAHRATVIIDRDSRKGQMRALVAVAILVEIDDAE
jgi:hypothetical protein